MPKTNKIIFKPWNLVITILIPVLIILLSGSFSLPNISNQYFYLFGMMVSLYTALHFFNIIADYIKMSKWSAADAVIVESRVNKIDDNESIMYEPVIKYKYTVGPTEYCSDKIYPYDKFNVSTLEAHTETITGKYLEGKTIKIFYNPSQPQESYIERKGIFPIIIFLLMFTAAFIIMLLAALGIITLQ